MNVPPPDLMRRHGFSLTETLVALAIVAVLLVLLMPATMWVREMMRATACTNNLRQAGVDIRRYIAENGGTLPSAPSASLKQFWWYVLYAPGEFENFNQRMVCPSDPNPYVYNFTYRPNQPLKTSYRYNVRMGRKTSDGTVLYPILNLALVSNASVVPALVEWHDPKGLSAGGDSATFGSGAGREIYTQHQNGRFGNVLYLDGHVGRISRAPVQRAGEWSWSPAY